MKPPSLQLRLSLSRDLTLTASLVNPSSVEYLVLLSNYFQPSDLELRDASGDPLTMPSRQMLIGANPNAHQEIQVESYTRIPAKKAVNHYSAPFTRIGNTYSIGWQRLWYQQLTPGQYEARVYWTSSFEDVWDATTGGFKKIEGVWQGSLESNPVPIKLPGK